VFIAHPINFRNFLINILFNGDYADIPQLHLKFGAVHKVRHAPEGSKKVWQFATEGRVKVMCDVTHFKFCIIELHMKPKIESDV